MRHTTAQDVADAIAKCLRDAIETREVARLVVCGGNSPLGVFAALAETALKWDAIHITLADDRQVPADDPDSNIKLLAEHLLKNHASAAHFTPLHALDASGWMPFDVVVLGMGADGHIASLFPDMLDDAAALKLDAPPQILYPEARGNPCLPRITMNLSMLTNSNAVFLLIKGAEKMAVINEALEFAQQRYLVGVLLAQKKIAPQLCYINDVNTPKNAQTPST